MSAAILACGLLAAAHYFWRRRWPDAALVLLASLALAALLLEESGQDRPSLLKVDSGNVASVRAAMRDAAVAQSIALVGDGLREAEWQDMPALPVQWTAPQSERLWLDFPRTLALGRVFELSVRRAPAPGAWRLQLVAENGQVLAESKANARVPALSVRWLPPVAEDMVLTARVLGEDGKPAAQGPVPLRVVEGPPLRLQGRFAAPSFDVRALSQLLSDSHALLDWRTQLGKSVARSETPGEAVTRPNAIVVDAAYMEGLAPSALASLLAQVGEGTPLLVLGAGASQPAFWQRALALRLVPQDGDEPRQLGQLAFIPAALRAVPQAPWQATAEDQDGAPWLLRRSWRKGRITWLGVGGWHRHAISEPMALAQWWQSVLDSAVRETVEAKAWRLPDPMPLPQLRTEVCVDGAHANSRASVGGMPFVLQPRQDRGGAACAALWPRQAGWMPLQADGLAGKVYVFAPDDWPAWQRALRQDATQRYLARGRTARQGMGDGAGATQPAAARIAHVMPAWCWAALFAAAMLLLWWRERR